MYYEIYQAKNPTFETFTNPTASEIKREDYKHVYSDFLTRVEFEDVDDDKKALEHLFIKFNVEARPANYNGHSMSVGDVVTITRTNEDGEKSTIAYVCEAFGWTEIEF